MKQIETLKEADADEGGVREKFYLIVSLRSKKQWVGERV